MNIPLDSEKEGTDNPPFFIYKIVLACDAQAKRYLAIHLFHCPKSDKPSITRRITFKIRVLGNEF